ncbi:hypothetical protein [Streptomyces sp. NPDC057199]|uniref:hypothetical protein n=1 Tax=Streptomyces sp. NPDC057199 TaxID=3346047 RepID=UPI0036393A4B
MFQLTVPLQVINQDQAPLHQHRRLAILRRALNDDSLPLRARVAAVLVLLYAQPATCIVHLTVDDILDDGATAAVRPGDPPSPLPGPVADLMRAYIQSRRHLPYASSRSSQWLFPGRRPGQPMNPVSLQVHLREIGVPSQSGRTSAIRQLVLQAPAPVIAKASATTTRPPLDWSPKPEELGPDTPQATTHGDPRTDLTEEYAKPQHASPPVSTPGSG